MYKYLTKIKAYIPLMPPIGNVPESQRGKLIENLSWSNDEQEEIKFIFQKPIKKYDRTSEKELYETHFFDYSVEITTETENIADAAERSIFLLEQVLDTSSFYSQAASKIIELISIVNLTQIEEIIKHKKGSYEKGFFKKQRIQNIKSFPPGRMVFLTEHGIKNIGRNMYWFRKGLNEISLINRFVSFFTALIELNYYFHQENIKDNTFPRTVKDYIELSLGAKAGSFKNWADTRNAIIHFAGKKKDYRKLSKQAKDSIHELYKYCYYSIAKFITDTPPEPFPLVIYEEIDKVVVDSNKEIVDGLTEIWERRHKGYYDINI